MPRRWRNSEGKNIDYEIKLHRSLDRLRREVMTNENYERAYGRNRRRRR